MTLTKYKKKRNFEKTAEPVGRKKKPKKKELIFVIQRHNATRLHYDFRLEVEGVLKSWAVPKGPSLNPNDKRLAVMVEDHPYDYKDFAGRIPEGNYGAGTVEIWDHGTYTPLETKEGEDPEKEMLKELKKGSLKVMLKGRKLKGEFALVRMKADENNWLLIKHRDKFATDEEYNSEEHTPKSSPINKEIAAKRAKKKD